MDFDLKKTMDRGEYNNYCNKLQAHCVPLSTFPERHSKERRPEGDSRFLRRFSGVLASVTLAGVGEGGRSAESVAALSPRVYSYIYNRVRVLVVLAGWLPLLLCS